LDSPSSLSRNIPTDDLPRIAFVERVSTQIASTRVVLGAVLSWLFELGIMADMPFYLKKNLALINRVTFISLLMAFPGSFVLLLVGFDHTFSLLVVGTLVLCLILGLAGAKQGEWAQAIFAFAPAFIVLGYTLLELSSTGMQDVMMYILARQGLCLSLLLPVIIYGYDKAHRGMVLASCVVLFLAFDAAVVRMGGSLLENASGMSRGFFSVISMLQLVGLAACVLYMQNYTLKHEQQVRHSNEKLHNMVVRDGMTGLFNHTFMEELIGDAINRSKRSKTPLSMLMIDVDFFKQINDKYGHNTGDEVLTRLAKLLEGSKRSTDYLGRWGGDELILLLTDTNLQGAVNLAEKLRNQVENQAFPHHNPLTISLGASEYKQGDQPMGFIERADAALYRAKRAGRNRVDIQV
jgi:diguanylate cyclase (GGDEF)-like protein